MRWTHTRRHEGRSGRRGLAMAPLIVTLAITAAGVGLVIPVVNSRQQDMAKARSMNNLRTLARATRIYTMDWGGTFPGWQKNPNGSYSHNVWDQQIIPYVGTNAAYTNGLPNGIRSSADPMKQRILSYGLNGQLICTPPHFIGSTRSTMATNEVGGKYKPILRRTDQMRRPEDTILFAELATELTVSQQLTVWNRPWVVHRVPDGSPGWESALDQWIDISPREFIQTASGYYEDSGPGWGKRGIARNLYDGGGNYAFVDGHVEFLPLSETVGLGQTVYPPVGSRWTISQGGMEFRPDNYLNMWNPDRVVKAGRERGEGPRWPIGR